MGALLSINNLASSFFLALKNALLLNLVTLGAGLMRPPCSSLSRSLSADSLRFAGGKWAVRLLSLISTFFFKVKVAGLTFMMECFDSWFVKIVLNSLIICCNQVGKFFEVRDISISFQIFKVCDADFTFRSLLVVVVVVLVVLVGFLLVDLLHVLLLL